MKNVVLQYAVLDDLEGSLGLVRPGAYMITATPSRQDECTGDVPVVGAESAEGHAALSARMLCIKELVLQHDSEHGGRLPVALHI